MLGSSVAAVLLFALTAFADSSASTCYYRRQDQILVKKDWQVCGNTATGSNGASLCCRNGDLCGEDSLCRSTNVQEGNEWYVGGCTNKDYKGTICNKACTSYAQTWAVYNNTGHGYWACCGDNDCADGDATTRMFDGVSPDDWSEITGSSSMSGLSTAAKIGIAVAAAVVGVAIIGGALACFCMRRRKRSAAAKSRPAFGRSTKKQYENIGPQGDVQMTAPFVPAGDNQPYSRSGSPVQGGLTPGYSDRRRSGSNPPPHQPPGDY